MDDLPFKAAPVLFQFMLLSSAQKIDIDPLSEPVFSLRKVVGRHVKSNAFVIYVEVRKGPCCPEERDRSEPQNSSAPISSPDSMSPDVLRTLCRWTWRAKCNFSGAAARAVARQTRPVLATQFVVICFFGQPRLTSLAFYFA